MKPAMRQPGSGLQHLPKRTSMSSTPDKRAPHFGWRLTSRRALALSCLREPVAAPYRRTGMADGHSHLIDFPEAIEVLSRGRPEDRPPARGGPGVDRIAETLRAGLAARERDVPATVQRISQAMQEVAALAAHADPVEAAAMRGRRSASAARSATPRRLPR